MELIDLLTVGLFMWGFFMMLYKFAAPYSNKVTLRRNPQQIQHSFSQHSQ